MPVLWIGLLRIRSVVSDKFPPALKLYLRCSAAQNVHRRRMATHAPADPCYVGAQRDDTSPRFKHKHIGIPEEVTCKK